MCAATYVAICLNFFYLQDWVQYFNTYFRKGGFSFDFNNNTTVIVETLDYFKMTNYHFEVTK